MFTFSPNDNRVSDRHGSSTPKDRNFGGNRKVTDNIQKAEDYTKPSLDRRANLNDKVEDKLIAPDATMDIDDMNDPEARKREESRRAETSNFDHSDRKFREPVDDYTETIIKSDSDNRPDMDGMEDDHIEPDPEAKHGSRNPARFGEDHDKRGDQNTGPTTKPR
jgi:hypothetical protein